mgnify:CR=1 FL=1
MSLPKIDLPIQEIKLPSTGKKIKFRPFTVKEEKILLVAQEIEEPDAELMAARQVINNHDILLNGKKVKANVFVTKGDIITFKDTIVEGFEYNKIVERISKDKKFLTFVEIDYYTKTIIILKDYKELSLEDLYLLVTEYLNLKNFSYNL